MKNTASEIQKPDLQEIVRALKKAGIPPELNADQSRVLLNVWQLIAKGQSVTPEQLGKISSKYKMTMDEVNSVLRKASEYDEDGNILGVFGLSQKEHPHRFQVKGYALSTDRFQVDLRLSTWCAWDSLFLPTLLKETAKVESSCPQTDEMIRLTVTPEKVEQFEPADAVLSIVLPKPNKEGPRSAWEIWMIFCNHVFFFSHAEALKKWFKGKDHEPIPLTVDEGYQLGLLAFKDILKYA